MAWPVAVQSGSGSPKRRRCGWGFPPFQPAAGASARCPPKRGGEFLRLRRPGGRSRRVRRPARRLLRRKLLQSRPRGSAVVAAFGKAPERVARARAPAGLLDSDTLIRHDRTAEGLAVARFLVRTSCRSCRVSIGCAGEGSCCLTQHSRRR